MGNVPLCTHGETDSGLSPCLRCAFPRSSDPHLHRESGHTGD